MAPTSKTESGPAVPQPAVSQSAMAPSAPSSGGRPVQMCPSLDEIDVRCSAWIGTPEDRAAWDVLSKLSVQAGNCESQTDKGKKQISSSYDAVSRAFWGKYSRLSTDKAATLVVQLVKFIGPSVSGFHEEVIITAIANDTKDVKDAVEDALFAIPEEQVGSGAVDAGFYKKCLAALAAAREKECGTNDGCYSKHAKLMELHRRYNRLVSTSIGVTFRSFHSFAGQALSGSAWCGQWSMEGLVGIENKSGIRPMLGGAYTGAFGQGGLDMLGMRAGFTQRGGMMGGRSMLYLEGGLASLTGKDNERDDIPITLDNPAVNGSRTAYRMKPQDIDRTLTAGYLMVNVEGAYPFAKGSPYHFFWQLGGGIWAGAVKDAKPSYSYRPGDGTVQVDPNGTVTATGELSSRNRAGDFSMGTMLGGGIGVRGIW